MESSGKKCFVIMPFSGTSVKHTSKYWGDHFNGFLKPLINSCGDIVASRSEALRQDIQRQIVNDLVFSDIVLADLTDSNPNVYWELGVRLSFRHGTITIAEENTKIPFDINTKGVLFYPTNLSERANFSSTLKEAINNCLLNPNLPDSFVLETITGRGSIYSVVHHYETLQRIEGLIIESKLNSTILNASLEAALKNKGRLRSKLQINWHVIVTHMGTSAIDLLLAEHYLEENEDFYEYSHSLLAMIYAFNKVLDDWSLNNESGKWLMEKGSMLKQTLGVYQQRLYNSKEKMNKCC